MDERVKVIAENLWKKRKKQFSRNIFKFLVDKKKRPDYRDKHCKKVEKIMNILLSSDAFLDKSLVQDLYFAARMHDIEKCKSNHAKLGAIYIDKNVEDNGLLNKENVKKFIEYHSTPKSREEDILAMDNELSSDMKKAIYLLRVSDKLSKFENPNEEEIEKVTKKAYKNSIKGIITKEERKKIEGILLNQSKDI